MLPGRATIMTAMLGILGTAQGGMIINLDERGDAAGRMFPSFFINDSAGDRLENVVAFLMPLDNSSIQAGITQSPSIFDAHAPDQATDKTDFTEIKPSFHESNTRTGN